MPLDQTEPQEQQTDDIGELDVSEYIVLLLAWDTYYRYLKEATGTTEPSDPVAVAGVQMLRRAEQQAGDGYHTFLDSNLPTPSHKKMLAKAWRYALTRDGLPRRALQIRTLLSRGGAATMRSVFKTNKALQQVRAAISASMVEDADAALDKFAVIQLRNMRIRQWITKAAETAGPGTYQNPVTAGTQQVSDDSDEILAARVQQTGSSPTSQKVLDAGTKQDDLLAKVQLNAQESAERALKVVGEVDEPPKKSEVIGIATAVATAMSTDPTKLANIPPSLRPVANDPEQYAAAQAQGRAIVAAGAGSGKTHTLTCRVGYLVNDLKVSANRIFACSFNSKASAEMRERIAAQVGADKAREMSVGTMHSLFKRFVTEYGTAEEKATLTTWLMPTSEKKRNSQRGIPSRAPTVGAMMGYMSRIWKECFNEDPPGRSGNVIQAWLMNNITPEQAKAQAASELEKQQAVWYEWFLGFKGILKGWSPPCVAAPPGGGRYQQKPSKASSQWGEFLAKWRNNGQARLGDFTDMIILFRDLLKRDVGVRKKVQAMFDHVAVDEAQDLNEVQHEIIAMMCEHVSPDGKDGRSWFMVGDEIQSINRFVGARPELFSQFTKRPDFKTYKITTNYRCLPEIIEAANRLMTHHPRQIEMEARPDPSKPRGSASVVVQTPSNHAEGAIQTITQIKQDVDAGSAITDYAVLTRTNMEQNDFETACIIQGVPYGRKGGTSFLKSPETVTVMCYFNLVVGQDFERMQKSLIEVIDKPRRFFLGGGQAETVVNNALRQIAQRKGISTTAVNPLELFDDPGFLLNAMDPDRRWPEWRVRAAQEQIENLGYELREMRNLVQNPPLDAEGKPKPYTTQALIGDILAVRGKPEKYGQPEPTLRDVLMPSASVQEEEADAPPDDEDDDSKKPIGNVQFLFQIAQPDPSSPDDPSDPLKFKARIDQLAADAKDLRVDLDAWYFQQQNLAPENRKPPPCVVLSTVHSVKGAQWNNTTVVMAGGIFPMAPRKKADEDNLPPEVLERLEKEREADFLTERQLAYVAMTRAAKSLTVICPDRSAYGREAGISRFVTEAELKVGQNVEGKNDPTPDPVPSAIKTAFSFFALKHENETLSVDDEPGPLVYDRRT